MRDENKWCVKGKRGGVDHNIYTAEHENDDLSQKKRIKKEGNVC